MFIINGRVLTMAGLEIGNGFVEIENGRIVSAGDMDGFRGMGEIIDAEGGYILPGLVDAHTHIGLFDDALGFEGEDGNEDTDPITPQIRALDGINSLDRCFTEALHDGGVTSVLVGPGSANPIAGQMVALKTRGISVDEMIIKQPAAIKFALGENPKGVYHSKNQAPVTRMATASLMREALFKARDYFEKLCLAEDDEDAVPPEYDFKCESLLPLITGEIPAHFHAHRADDIFTAVRIAGEFGLKYAIIHATESHMIADRLDKSTGLILGPLMLDRSKPELANQTDRAPGILTSKGFMVAITTDHPEMPQKNLRIAACTAVKEGMDKDAALRAITIDAARLAGIDSRVGSIESGKDADIAVFSAHPLDFYAKVKFVFINGEKYERD